MISRTAFVEEYKTYFGMDSEALNSRMAEARDKLLVKLNAWRDEHKTAKILDLSWDGYTSMRWENNPLWERVVVTYEE